MKKRIVMVTSVLLVMVLMMAACGAKTVQNYIDAQQEQLDELTAQTGDLMDIAVEARDDSTLLYKFTMLDDSIPLDAAQLEAGLDAQSATYDAILAEMDQYGISNPSIVIEYIDAAGELVLSKTFTQAAA